MKNWKNFQKNIRLKKQLKKEQNKQKNKSKKKLKKNKIYFGKNANVTEKEEYLEISVTYEVIENIGMQEKIEKVEQKTEEPAR